MNKETKIFKNWIVNNLDTVNQCLCRLFEDNKLPLNIFYAYKKSKTNEEIKQLNLLLQIKQKNHEILCASKTKIFLK